MRYIDPYQLADKVAESMRDNPHEGKLALNHRLEHEHFLRMIALAPDADVEPVIHAKWVWFKGFDNSDFAVLACSACLETEGANKNFDYCPGCGAKMDAEGF
jgi:hypothetical protein